MFAPRVRTAFAVLAFLATLALPGLAGAAVMAPAGSPPDSSRTTNVTPNYHTGTTIGEKVFASRAATAAHPVIGNGGWCC